MPTDTNIQRLSVETKTAIQQGLAGYTEEKAQRFIKFYQRLETELLQHPIIVKNNFTDWFQSGDFTEVQLKKFIVQFSVFSNLFIMAQLEKTINAESLAAMRASKEILVNELGVVFRNENGKTQKNDVLSEEGSVEGGVFHFKAAHFEWLYQLADRVGLKFTDIGKRRHGNTSTLFFCDALSRLYANENYTTSQAASFAVENWAAAGFWGQLIQGLTIYKDTQLNSLPIFFFTHHDKIEAQHAQHTRDELEEVYFKGHIDEDLFISSGNEMLDAVAIFWQGLNEQRLNEPPQ